jgi:hypothetical protein
VKKEFKTFEDDRLVWASWCAVCLSGEDHGPFPKKIKLGQPNMQDSKQEKSPYFNLQLSRLSDFHPRTAKPDILLPQLFKTGRNIPLTQTTLVLIRHGRWIWQIIK